MLIVNMVSFNTIIGFSLNGKLAGVLLLVTAQS